MGKIPTGVLRKPSEGLQNQGNWSDVRPIVAVHISFDPPTMYDFIEFFNHQTHFLGSQIQHMIIAGA